MYRVFLTDDHAILREGLKALLQTDPELCVVGESSTGTDTILQIADEELDLLVLDLYLPDIDGLEVLQQVKALQPTLPVLILTLHNDEILAARVLRAGASGYAVKDMTPAQIVEAMRCVAAGGRYLGGSMASRLAGSISSPEEDLPPHTRLSEREYSIFIRIIAGHSIHRISQELSISPSTVSTHRAHILEKMRLANNSELVRYAIAQGILL